MNVARVAEILEVPRPRARRVLSGEEPMTVDELVRLGEVMKIDPTELGMMAPAEGSAADESRPSLTLVDGADAPKAPDSFGNHPEALFRMGYALGCDFLFMARTEDLADSGIPRFVLEQYKGRGVPIRLDAGFHHEQRPRYSADALTLRLAFDEVVDCVFPWSSVQQVIFFPLAPEPPARQPTPPTPPPEARPRLRLVK
jgi:hypothetical protein